MGLASKLAVTAPAPTELLPARHFGESTFEASPIAQIQPFRRTVLLTYHRTRSAYLMQHQCFFQHSSSTEDDLQKQLEEKSSRVEASAQSFDANDSMQQKPEKRISSPGMHLRDRSDQEKFFVRNAEAPNKSRGVTVLCDYYDVILGSLKDDSKVLHYQPLMNTTIDPLNSNTVPDSLTQGPPPPPLPNSQVIGPPPFWQYPSPFAPPPPPPFINYANEPIRIQQAGLVPIHYSGDTALCPDHLFRILLLERHIFLTFYGARVVEFDKYQRLFRDGNFDVWYEELWSILKRITASEIEPVHPEHQQPVRTNRILLKDTTCKHIPDRVSDARHKDCSRLSTHSIWKPLYGPLTDWPLSVCDSRSISTPRDCIATDVVEREGFTENYQLYYYEDMQFCYLSGQLASEVILFRQTDTKKGCGTGVPHAGFRNPKTVAGERPRESIETRVFLYF